MNEELIAKLAAMLLSGMNEVGGMDGDKPAEKQHWLWESDGLGGVRTHCVELAVEVAREIVAEVARTAPKSESV